MFDVLYLILKLRHMAVQRRKNHQHPFMISWNMMHFCRNSCPKLPRILCRNIIQHRSQVCSQIPWRSSTPIPHVLSVEPTGWRPGVRAVIPSSSIVLKHGIILLRVVSWAIYTYGVVSEICDSPLPSMSRKITIYTTTVSRKNFNSGFLMIYWRLPKTATASEIKIVSQHIDFGSVHGLSSVWTRFVRAHLAT